MKGGEWIGEEKSASELGSSSSSRSSNSNSGGGGSSSRSSSSCSSKFGISRAMRDYQHAI